MGKLLEIMNKMVLQKIKRYKIHQCRAKRCTCILGNVVGITKKKQKSINLDFSFTDNDSKFIQELSDLLQK
jgi:hypothetical protein